jgi:hypothetical protein
LLLLFIETQILNNFKIQIKKILEKTKYIQCEIHSYSDFAVIAIIAS